MSAGALSLPSTGADEEDAQLMTGSARSGSCVLAGLGAAGRVAPDQKRTLHQGGTALTVAGRFGKPVNSSCSMQKTCLNAASNCRSFCKLGESVRSGSTERHREAATPCNLI